MRYLKTSLILGIAAIVANCAHAQDYGQSGQLSGQLSGQISGQVRVLMNSTAENLNSPLHQAALLLPAMNVAADHLGVAEAELRFSRYGINAIGTLQGQSDDFGHSHATGWINELYGAFDSGAWQFSAGKKIVAWDVGYGFRPNDVVQQERRRSLISNTAIGRPLAMAEYFDADNALSLVWVNPRQTSSQTSAIQEADEQALAARLYRRIGALDLHGFARYGRQNGASLGAAMAWVATDALELHVSVRHLQRSSTLVLAGQSGQAAQTAQTALLQAGAPWQAQAQYDVKQLLAGMVWTTESQHSFMLEAWWDGAAPSERQWRQWAQRNQALMAAIDVSPRVQAAIGGQLAAQNQLLSAAANLHRKNLFARWSWQSAAWQPALDVLWTPADHGHVLTASLGWQGDRLRLDGGIRHYGGPADSAYAQLPSASVAYLSAAWAF
jgi:hypothetical protein